MSLQPDLRKPLWIGWGVLAGALVLSALTLWWISDDSTEQQQLVAGNAQVKKLIGNETKAVELLKRVTDEKESIARLKTTIDTLKQRNGLVRHAPWILPGNLGVPETQQYIRDNFVKLREDARKAAKAKSITFDETMGFSIGGSAVPKASDAEAWLTMMQVTRKMLDIINDTNGKPPIKSFKFTHKTSVPKGVITGPTGRPPLLKEWPFRLDVRGNLDEILRILHRLSKTEIEGDFPLVLRSLVVDSQKSKLDDNIGQWDMDATFEIAAMQFLNDEERTTAAAEATKPGAGGLGNR